MSLDNVTPGKRVPENFNVIIEIPMNADPIKYEVDKETGALFVDRFMMTAMHYPCNYGYIPHTIGEDGDPVDVLVITPFAVTTGSELRCGRLVCLGWMMKRGATPNYLPYRLTRFGLHLSQSKLWWSSLLNPLDCEHEVSGLKFRFRLQNPSLHHL